ncbi:MAG: glycosyltransferase [Gemmatimonadota bacterium]
MLVHCIIGRLDIGAAAMQVVHLARGMNHDRFRTRLMAGAPLPGEPDMRAYAAERGVEVHPLPGTGLRFGAEAGGGGASADPAVLHACATFFAFRRHFRRERPHIVHTHGDGVALVARVAAVLARVPVLVHTAGPVGGILERDDGLAPCAPRSRRAPGAPRGGSAPSPVAGEPAVTSPGASKAMAAGGSTTRGAHAGGPPAGVTASGPSALRRASERWVARFTRRILTDSEWRAKALAERLETFPRKRIRVIRPGLELERLTALPIVYGDSDAALVARAMLGLDDDTWVVGVVGRLEAAKNHALLFDAVASLEEDDVRVLVVGGGEREAELRAYAARRGLESRVTWLGWRDDLSDIYPAMDVLAVPANEEGASAAIIEALAAGVPVVARAGGGISETLDFGCYGRMVAGEEGEPLVRAFAAAIDETLEDPPAVALRRDARRAVSRRYEIGRLLREMEDLYVEALIEAGVMAEPLGAGPGEAG